MFSDSEGYYFHSRQPMVALLDRSCHRVLDVGCGAGRFGALLKSSGRAREVYGLELNSEAAKISRNFLDDVVHCDLNEMDGDRVAQLFDGITFDCVFLGDVLEHLQDPWTHLAWFVDRLADSGTVIASIPNIRHWSIITALIFKGEFTYTDQGILDRTHLRFFTKKSIIHLFQEVGLRIEVIQPNVWGQKQRFVDRMTLKLGRGFLANQWLVRARK